MTSTTSLSVNPFVDDKYLGKVVQVGRSSVRIVLAPPGDSVSSGNGQADTVSGKVGDFVVIARGGLAIFGQLIDVAASEMTAVKGDGREEHELELQAVGRVQLLTTVEVESGDVSPGVLETPRIGDEVYSADPETVRRVAETRRRDDGKDKQVTLQIARLSQATDSPVSFTPEMLFGRHCAFLGTTGAGKSWSIARMVEEVAKYRCKVILFDATGEFYRLKDGVKHVHLGNDPSPLEGSKELVLPYYHLTEGDLFAIFRPTGQSQAPKLRAAIKSLKLAMLSPSLALDGVIVKVHKAKDQYETQYKRYYSKVESAEAHFDIRKLTRQIENECVNPNRSALEPMFWGDYNGTDLAYCTPLITRIQDILRSPELSTIFNFHDKPSLIDEVDSFLADDTVRILRVSLKYLSFAHNAREIVANATGRHLLRLARNGRFRESPLLVVVDEAHQFLDKVTAGEDNNFPLDAFAVIAKEGRKYALNICLSTQRPRDIPASVLSQMGTLVVHRLINDQDRAVVERASTEIDRSSMASLPTLAPGEAVIIGIDFPVPLSVRMEVPTCEPDSKGPDYQQHWS